MAPELVAERLLDVMRQPFELDGATMPLIVNTSIGIAIGDRDTAGDLLRDADVALYEAKAAGKNRYEVFDPEMQTEILRRIELEFDLRSALDRRPVPPRLPADLQPRRPHRRRRRGVAALGASDARDRPARRVHPHPRTDRPDPRGRPLGAPPGLRADGGLARRGDTLDVSVNVSGRQLDNDDIVDDIRDALATSGLAATSLIIEVTETALMRNAATTARRLQAIKDLGVRIAVDDFGTGYSSLAYLQQFPVDCLKIDRTFTNAITTSPESKALIGTLVQLGKDLGLTTLAEGVETTGQIDHLRGEHVNEVQGFLLSRPLDADTLETQLLAPVRPGTQRNSGTQRSKRP